MTKQQMQNEISYTISLGIARNMLRESLLTDWEYIRLEKLLLEKYNPVISSLGE